jgi:hypothetical protein
VTDVSYRQAALGDAAAIHALLLALAPAIPLLVATLEREEALYALIRNCCRSGESWLACDDRGRIVGFALAERAERGRHYAEHEVLELRYAAVTDDQPAVIVGRLVERLLDRMVPVVAMVSPRNRMGLADSLERLGFRPAAAPGGERHLRWEPGDTG